MKVTAKADYAVRAAIELANAQPRTPVKGEQLSNAQQIPMKFLENILAELKRSGLVCSQRGAEGGYWLARAPETITVAEIIRAVEGPLANVRGTRPESLEYHGAAVPLQRVWIGLRASLRSVLEQVTLADITADALPAHIETLAHEPDAWEPH